MSKNKKIGIITIHKVNNYGAELQTFALQKKLVRLGFDAEIIDYLFSKHKDYIFTKQARPFVNLGFVRRIKKFLSPLIAWIKSFPYRKVKRSRESKFELFHRKYTRLSLHIFRSINDLYRAKLDYDVFMVVGSNQVWNPYNNPSLKPYFLTFTPEGKPKVAYASSFGVSFTFHHSMRNLLLDPTLLLDVKDGNAFIIQKG